MKSLFVVLLTALLVNAARADEIDGLYALWDYNEPATSEHRFRELLDDAQASNNPDFLPILLSQLARTYSLRERYPEALGILRDATEMVPDQNSRAFAYLLIEYGRVYNSDNDKARAVEYFEDAFRVAERNGDDFLAIDAAHMVAIAAPLEEQMKWNTIALGIAEQSDSERAQRWKGSLYNNMGWTHFDLGNYEQALALFEKSAAFRLEQKQRRRYQIARWAVARTYRALGRFDDAVAIQQKLLQENKERGDPDDGYVMEELGELYLAMDNPDAPVYFKRAFELLGNDRYLQAEEPDRLARIRQLAGLD